MSRIPRDFIHELLTRTEIVDLIETRVPIRKKSSNNYFACCPFHAEKSASFSVSQNKQFYHCFGCGAHGNAIDFLMQFDRLSFPEAIASLAQMAGLPIPENHAVAPHKPASTEGYALMEAIAKFYQSKLRQHEPAIQYLKQRGVRGEIAKHYGLGYAPAGWNHLLSQFGGSDAAKNQLIELGMLIKKEDGTGYDRFRDRIMFPIYDRRGRIVGFGGRILLQGEPKYLNSPETPLFQKGQELYGLHQALNADRLLPRALLVEGYMDVIALSQHEITYSMATLGTATTSLHIQRLMRLTQEIIFCFDGDAAGRTAAWRALLVSLPLIRDELNIRFMFLPENEDPDSLIHKEGKANFETRIAAASPLSQFFFQQLAVQNDLSSMDGRARFIKQASEHIKSIPEGIFQRMLLQALAKKGQVAHVELQTETENPKKPQMRARSPSNLRMALTLLIQDPMLAWHVEAPLEPLEIPGFKLFSELLTTIQTHQITTTGILLEHWRDRKDAGLLLKFAKLTHLIPEKGITAEFLSAINQLKALYKKSIIQKLLAKAAQGELHPTEKIQLNSLIQSQK